MTLLSGSGAGAHEELGEGVALEDVARLAELGLVEAREVVDAAARRPQARLAPRPRRPPRLQRAPAHVNSDHVAELCYNCNRDVHAGARVDAAQYRGRREVGSRTISLCIACSACNQL